jgi:hypothetical protein
LYACLLFLLYFMTSIIQIRLAKWYDDRDDKFTLSAVFLVDKFIFYDSLKWQFNLKLLQFLDKNYCQGHFYGVLVVLIGKFSLNQLRV